MISVAYWADHLRYLVQRYKEKLGLGEVIVSLTLGMNDNRMTISAEPEYLEAKIAMDRDKLETGDDLEEMVSHELSHYVHWELHQVAEDFAKLAANGNALVEALYLEQVRRAAELATTRWGRIVHRLVKEGENENRH